METKTLDAALKQEHRQIDEGIEAFTRGGTDMDALAGSMQALRRHIYLEEELLFPPLQAAGMFGPIFVMLREHGEMWIMMDALQIEMTERPDSAVVLERCKELVAELEAHNLKEEQILYSQADALLGAEAGGTLAEFLESGEMPERWVCDGTKR